MSINLVMTAEEMNKNRQAWLDLRKNYIGGSDAAVVVGVNTHRSPFALWLEKTGQAEPEDLSNNTRVWFGQEAEEIVAKRFCMDERKKVRRSGVWVNDKYPWACASIDRMLVGENAFLECKTSASYFKDRWGEDSIPDAYYCQVLHYMTVLEMDYCYIACLFDNGADYIVRTVEFNQADSDALMEAERKFWEECVKGGKLPDADSSKACTDALKIKFPGGGTEALDMEEQYDILCGDIKSLKASKKELDKAIDLKENQLRMVLENHEFGRTSGYNVWYKTQAKKPYFDREQFERDYPGVYEKYLIRGTQRVLRITERKS